jgi:pyruvate dehydrogenase E1 component beta subunit
MPELKYYQAVREGLALELRRDPTTLLLGEDIGRSGGIFAQTRGLYEEFGAERVFDTPAGEVGFMGAAVGCALTGLRPIVEISFADFLLTCMDGIVNQAAKIRFMSGGQTSVPLTILTFGGGGLSAGPQHSGTYEAWLGSVPGLKVVAPATPTDVKGLIQTAVRDDDPVVVILNKALLQQREEADEEIAPIPLGSAVVRRPGGDLTLVAWSGGLRRALRASTALAQRGIDVEVIDVRSIQPLDIGTIATSVRKTRHLAIVQETTLFAGIGAEIAYGVVHDAFDYLDAPIERIGPPFTPTPFSPVLEDAFLPSDDELVSRVAAMLA